MSATVVEKIAVSRDCVDCDFCGSASPPKCCSQCNSAYYCNRDCQKSHWKQHKYKCRKATESYDNWKAANSSTEGNATDIVEGPCAICLEDTVTNPVLLDCGHVFCFSCLGQYQLTPGGDKSCPLCKRDLPHVPLQGHDRAQNYFRRALNKPEGSEARKKYAELASAEYDALLKLGHPNVSKISFLFLRAKMLTYAREPVEVASIAVELLSVNEKGDNGKLDDNEVLEVELWIAETLLVCEDWDCAVRFFAPLWKKACKIVNEGEDGAGGYAATLVCKGLCRAHYELGNYDHAIKWGEFGIKCGRAFSGIHKYVALAQKAKGDIDAAKRTISRAILYEQRGDEGNLQQNQQILKELKEV